MNPIIFEYTLSLEEVSEGIGPTLRTRAILVRLMLFCGLCFGILNIWMSASAKQPWVVSLPWYGYLVLIAFMAYRTRNLGRNAYRRIYQQSVTLQSPFQTTLDDSGVVQTNYYISSNSRWERFTHWKELRRSIVLYEGRIALILPKRAMAGNAMIEAVRDLCRRHIHHQKYHPPLRAFAPEPLPPP